LETVCEALAVPLIWGTWNEENNELFKYLTKERPDYFRGYIDVDSIDASKLDATCEHEHLRGSHPHCFDLGSDVGWISEEPDQHRHAGAHLHTHWAETFLKNISV
jgi:hypothetical protein